MRLIDHRLSETNEPQLESLLSELEHTARVKREPSLTLYNYLLQCLASWDGGKRLNLDKNRVIPGGLLSRKVGKLVGTPIYQVCDEIARISGQTVEIAETTALYVFLNRSVPNLFEEPKSRPLDPRDWL